jgi:hypothetical protein
MKDSGQPALNIEQSDKKVVLQENIIPSVGCHFGKRWNARKSIKSSSEKSWI